MRTELFDDLTELWQKTWRSMLWSSRDGLDLFNDYESIRFDLLLSADSMSFDFNMSKQLGLGIERWTKLISDYLDLSHTARFLERSEEVALGDVKDGAIVGLATRHVPRHHLGNCILGFTFHGNRETPVLSMYSRTTYITYIGALDLALARALGVEIARRLKISVEDFAFNWHLGSAQFNAINSIPTILTSYPEFAEKIDELKPAYVHPTINAVLKWYKMFKDSVDGKGGTTYAPVRRAVSRYTRIPELPDIPVSSMTIRSLWRVGRG